MGFQLSYFSFQEQASISKFQRVSVFFNATGCGGETYKPLFLRLFIHWRLFFIGGCCGANDFLSGRWKYYFLAVTEAFFRLKEPSRKVEVPPFTLNHLIVTFTQMALVFYGIDYPGIKNYRRNKCVIMENNMQPLIVFKQVVRVLNMFSSKQSL